MKIEAKEQLPHFMEKYKFAILDMDGTLFDTPIIYFKAHQMMAMKLKKFNFTLTHQRELVSCRREEGVTSMELFTKMIGYPIPLTDKKGEMLNDLEKVRDSFFDTALETLGDDLVKPGVLKILDFLEIHKIPTAISTVSSRNKVNKLFASQRLLDINRFISITTSDKVPQYLETRQKQLINQAALNQLQSSLTIDVNPTEGIMFEDSITGVSAAKNVGMGFIVAIPDEHTKHSALTGDRFGFHNANIVAQDFNYLHTILSASQQ